MLLVCSLDCKEVSRNQRDILIKKTSMISQHERTPLQLMVPSYGVYLSKKQECMTDSGEEKGEN